MKTPVVKVWAVRSRTSGALYEVIQRECGMMSCDCPAWIYQRKGQERGCKHIRMVLEGHAKLKQIDKADVLRIQHIEVA